ncbi:hypothetical protein P43SY_003707 [Pythium insidiosum]|uniref:Uncharacterized protein n=1 Tax=Pythium insidiosum TaxID=114742 RepID=A0AAD5Q2M0_PYTIN|nr:hypothetical protein P43SY_003707 [Pythium insidiosum]
MAIAQKRRHRAQRVVEGMERMLSSLRWRRRKADDSGEERRKPGWRRPLCPRRRRQQQREEAEAVARRRALEHTDSEEDSMCDLWSELKDLEAKLCAVRKARCQPPPPTTPATTSAVEKTANAAQCFAETKLKFTAISTFIDTGVHHRCPNACKMMIQDVKAKLPDDCMILYYPTGFGLRPRPYMLYSEIIPKFMADCLKDGPSEPTAAPTLTPLATSPAPTTSTPPTPSATTATPAPTVTPQASPATSSPATTVPATAAPTTEPSQTTPAPEPTKNSTLAPRGTKASSLDDDKQVANDGSAGSLPQELTNAPLPKQPIRSSTASPKPTTKSAASSNIILSGSILTVAVARTLGVAGTAILAACTLPAVTSQSGCDYAVLKEVEAMPGGVQCAAQTKLRFSSLNAFVEMNVGSLGCSVPACKEMVSDLRRRQPEECSIMFYPNYLGARPRSLYLYGDIIKMLMKGCLASTNRHNYTNDDGTVNDIAPDSDA